MKNINNIIIHFVLNAMQRHSYHYYFLVYIVILDTRGTLDNIFFQNTSHIAYIFKQLSVGFTSEFIHQ